MSIVDLKSFALHVAPNVGHQQYVINEDLKYHNQRIHIIGEQNCLLPLIVIVINCDFSIPTLVRKPICLFLLNFLKHFLFIFLLYGLVHFPKFWTIFSGFMHGIKIHMI